LTLAEQQEFEVHKILDHREKHTHHMGKRRPNGRREAMIIVVVHGKFPLGTRKESAECAQESDEYWETILQA